MQIGNMQNNKSEVQDLSDVTFVKRITVGTINPNAPYSDEHHDQAIALLNRCIGEAPRGKIIGKDIAFGVYQMGEHQLSMQKVTYHIGFKRKPVWLID